MDLKIKYDASRLEGLLKEYYQMYYSFEIYKVSFIQSYDYGAFKLSCRFKTKIIGNNNQDDIREVIVTMFSLSGYGIQEIDFNRYAVESYFERGMNYNWNVSITLAKQRGKTKYLKNR